jgi:hypothetical protein
MAYKSWLQSYSEYSLIPKYSFIGNFRETSKTVVNDTRNLPFINDIFDVGINGLNNDDCVLFTNMDICLFNDSAEKIKKFMKVYDCGYSPRLEVDNIPDEAQIDFSRYTHAKYGCDLFFFKVGWWKTVRLEYPKFFIGCCGWDMVLMATILKHGGGCVFYTNYHRNHKSGWDDTSPSNNYNKRNSYVKQLELIDWLPDDGNKKQDRYNWLLKMAESLNVDSP